MVAASSTDGVALVLLELLTTWNLHQLYSKQFCAPGLHCSRFFIMGLFSPKKSELLVISRSGILWKTRNPTTH